MKNKLVKAISIILLLFAAIFAIAYTIFEFNAKKIFDTKVNIASIFSETDKKDSSDKENVLAKTPEEENKKIDRSKTIDSNKIESIIKKNSDGVITNIDLKNDSKNLIIKLV